MLLIIIQVLKSSTVHWKRRSYFATPCKCWYFLSLCILFEKSYLLDILFFKKYRAKNILEVFREIWFYKASWLFGHFCCFDMLCYPRKSARLCCPWFVTLYLILVSKLLSFLPNTCEQFNKLHIIILIYF